MPSELKFLKSVTQNYGGNSNGIICIGEQGAD
jgi:hypothetical protein